MTLLFLPLGCAMQFGLVSVAGVEAPFDTGGSKTCLNEWLEPCVLQVSGFGCFASLR